MDQPAHMPRIRTVASSAGNRRRIEQYHGEHQPRSLADTWPGAVAAAACGAPQLGSVRTMAPYIHTHRFRIAMSEVDVAQIHFTALFRWMDRGLSEWLWNSGHPFTDLLADGPGIPVVDAHAQFRKRILLDDEIELTTWIAAVGTSSFRSRHWFIRHSELVADGELIHVCLDRTTRTASDAPSWLRELATSDEWRPVDLGQ